MILLCYINSMLQGDERERQKPGSRKGAQMHVPREKKKNGRCFIRTLYIIYFFKKIIYMPLF